MWKSINLVYVYGGKLMITKAPRGTADILPQDIEKWQFIEETAKKTAKKRRLFLGQIV